jgi:hypothetical protein
MLRSLLVAGLAVSVVAGASVVGLRTVGREAKATFDTLNQALEDSTPGKGKASARDAAQWIERYRAGARGARCRDGGKGWDYVCVFRDGDGRRRKVGVIVGARQPTQMSPLVGVRRPLPTPSGGA